jgi:hypothetical protein
MKTLILHLSDIHIKTPEDPVLARVEQIVNAVKNLDVGINALVCVISGDIVFAGTEEQYDLALGFLGEIKKKLDLELSPLTCRFVIVPGNHDCDFREAIAVRDSVLPKVREKPSHLTEPSHMEVCLDPLKRFFDFRAAIEDTPPDLAAPAADSRVYCERHFIEAGEAISFLCYNTAILSTLHEQPGQLIFPTTIIPSVRPVDAAVISVFHHPANWLEPNCSRAFRSKIEAISDIVLTGHEHFLDTRHVMSSHGDASYIEGGALQETGDAHTSEFNVLLLDTTTRQKRHISFVWSGSGYKAAGTANPDQFYLWESFTQNSFRMRQSYQLLPEFAASLDDPEITLTHRVKGTLTLSDIFVFPDLQRLKQPGEKGREVVRSECVPDLVLEKPHLFILGDDQSGKTSLAKRLFLHLRDKGDIPVLLDVAKQKLTAKSCVQDIEAAFLKNYAADSLDAYRQSDRARRVVIVDNYHRAKIAPRNKLELLDAIKQQSFRVIVLAHDTALTLYDLTSSSANEVPFLFYSILPFSYIQQNRLIEKWLLLGGLLENDTAEFVANLDRTRRAMDTIFGKNYVPPFPPYMLAILQANESATPLDLKANAHGYFYELFITQLVAKHSSSSIVMNILKAYLSHVAHEIHYSGHHEIEGSKFRVLHSRLSNEFEVLPGFADQTDQLVKMQILTKSNDSFRFRQPYIYYYFLALYLHNHLDEPQVFEAINRLARELYKEESASTLLFLSHLNKDRRILETLLAVCDSEFATAIPARLEEDVSFVNQLRTDVCRLDMPDQPPSELRKLELERLELQRQNEIAYEQANQSALESQETMVGRLNAAIKTIQILGQYLKNFPADIGKAEKDRIILATSTLASRVLGGCFSPLRDHQAESVKDMVMLLGRQKPDLDDEEIKARAVNALVVMSEWAATGMIWRLAQSLGSSELMNTYDRFFGEQTSAFMKLTHLALKLDHNETFPEAFLVRLHKEVRTNAFAFRLMQKFVRRRLFMFHADYRLKQKLSALLLLDYKQVQVPKPEQRLVK